MTQLTDEARKLIDQHLTRRFIQVVSAFGIVNVVALVGIWWAATTAAQSAATLVASDAANVAINRNKALQEVTDNASKKALDVFESAATMKGKISIMNNMIDEVQTGRLSELQTKVGSMEKRMKTLDILLASTEKDDRVTLLNKAQGVLDAGGKDILDNAEQLSLRLAGIEERLFALAENEVLKALISQVTVYELDGSIDQNKVPITAMFDFPAIHIRHGLTANTKVTAVDFVKNANPITFDPVQIYPEFKKAETSSTPPIRVAKPPAKITFPGQPGTRKHE